MNPNMKSGIIVITEELITSKDDMKHKLLSASYVGRTLDKNHYLTRSKRINFSWDVAIFRKWDPF